MMSLKGVGHALVALVTIFACPLAWSSAHPTAVLTIVATASGGANGSITITVNGHTETVNVGQFSTPSSIASGFAAEFSQDPVSSLPELCTVGICAKAEGAKIIFQLEDATTFQAPIIIEGAAAFSVDQSQWPATPTQSALPMALTCSPNPMLVGGSLSCSAGLPTGTTGSVFFQLDGTPWQTVSIDSSGNAVVSSSLPTVTTGDHLVTSSYMPPNGLPSSAYQTFTVEPSAAPPVSIYSYYIQKANQQSGYMLNDDIAGYVDSVNGMWGTNSNGTATPIIYDNLHRLVSAPQTSQSGTSYNCWGYDSFGNRLIQASSDQPPTSSLGSACQQASGASAYYATASSFANSTNQISGRSTIGLGSVVSQVAAPGYDTTGNIVQDFNNTYLYDTQGHICAAHTAFGMVGYLYDASGHRVAKGTISAMTCDPSVGSFTVTNVYAVDGQTSVEIDGATASRVNVTANGQTLATYDANGLHFHLYDWLGTRRVQTNFAGVPEEYCQSQPFGDGQNCYNSTAEASNQHFTGMERDAESGLDLLGARYYNSSLGRFTRPDPSGLTYADFTNPQSLNLYSYALNNPLRFTDRSGLTICDWGPSDTHSGNDYDNDDDCVKDGGTIYEDHQSVSVTANVSSPTVDLQSQSIAMVIGGANATDVSPAGLLFTANCEAFRGKAYNDSNGNCTVGFGHMTHRGPCTQAERDQGAISRQTGVAMLHEDMASAVAAVNGQVKVDLTQYQFDAMAEFTYNVGAGGLQQSAALHDLNSGNVDQVGGDFGHFHRGGTGIPTRRSNTAVIFNGQGYPSSCYKK